MANIQWTAHEYEILLAYNHLSDEALSAQLPKRTTGAIAAQRAVIHNYHMIGFTQLAKRIRRRQPRDQIVVGGRPCFAASLKPCHVYCSATRYQC
jgi:hypothetical protein